MGLSSETDSPAGYLAMPKSLSADEKISGCRLEVLKHDFEMLQQWMVGSNEVHIVTDEKHRQNTEDIGYNII